MKNLLKYLSLIIMLQFVALSLFGQFTCLLEDSTQTNYPDDQ